MSARDQLGPAELFVVVASHPSLAVELMLQHKQLPYRRRELPAGLSGPLLRLHGFADRTVPAFRVGGRRVQGSLNISRRLDAMEPSSPLFPPDPDERAAVVEAEAWGEQFQDLVRRIELWGLSRRPSAVAAQLKASNLPIPPRLGAALSPATVRYLRRIHRASDEAVHDDLRDLPAMLEQLDEWVRSGLLNGGELSAADFQIAPSVALLATMEDLGPLLHGRPSLRLAERLVPQYPAHLPPGTLFVPRAKQRTLGMLSLRITCAPTAGTESDQF